MRAHTAPLYSVRVHTVPRGSLRASAVRVWINCPVSPVMYGKLSLKWLPNDGDSLSWRPVSEMSVTFPLFALGELPGDLIIGAPGHLR